MVSAVQCPRAKGCLYTQARCDHRPTRTLLHGRQSPNGGTRNKDPAAGKLGIQRCRTQLRYAPKTEASIQGPNSLPQCKDLACSAKLNHTPRVQISVWFPVYFVQKAPNCRTRRCKNVCFCLNSSFSIGGFRGWGQPLFLSHPRSTSFFNEKG